MDCDGEFACEIRKRAYQQAFQEYEQKISKSSVKKKAKAVENKNQSQDITNLPRNEQSALKSLKYENKG